VPYAHGAQVDAARERPEVRALDRPALVQIDNQDEPRAGRLTRLDGTVGALLEVGVVADQVTQSEVRKASDQPHAERMPEPALTCRGGHLTASPLLFGQANTEAVLPFGARHISLEARDGDREGQ
jgi:hypothetical protein